MAKQSPILLLKKEYEAFWDSFKLKCKGLAVSPSDTLFKFDPVGNHINVSLNSPIHLKNWPYKSESHKKNNSVDILIDSKEQISAKDLAVLKSTVNVTYFAIQNRGKADANLPELAKPIESIHYDFESEQKKAHPLFHAQFCRNIIEKSVRDKSESFKNYTVSPESINDERNQHLKIPTSHMGLFSVLICICADHGSAGSTDRLKEIIQVINKQKTMPKAGFSSIYGKIGTHATFKSAHWYSEA